MIKFVFIVAMFFVPVVLFGQEKDTIIARIDFKLNLTSKEIGNMPGISADSVNKSCYRLRKKLNLEAEANLKAFTEKV